MSKYSPLISRTLRQLSQAQLAQFSNEDWDALLELALTDDFGNQTEEFSQPEDRASNRSGKNRNEALVVKTIEPLQTGQIRFQGAWWSARCVQQITLLPGEVVKVVGHQNITLLVQPTRTSLQSEGVNPNSSWQLSTQINKKLGTKTESKLNKAENKRLSLVQNFVEKGDRAIAFSAGGAFLGGLIAQIPGAVVGALAGAIFGWFEKSKPASSSEDSR